MDSNRESFLLSLRALELASTRVKEACNDVDIDAAAIEAHFGLHAVYDLHEAYFRPLAIGSIEAQDSIYTASGGESVGGLILARGAKTHRLVTFARPGGFPDRPYGMGPYGPGWIWKEYSWNEPKFQVRSSWYEKRVSSRMLWQPLDEAWWWFCENTPEESA